MKVRSQVQTITRAILPRDQLPSVSNSQRGWSCKQIFDSSTTFLNPQVGTNSLYGKRTVGFFSLASHALRACEARALRARKTLTARFTDFFTDFEKKTDCFAVYFSPYSDRGGFGSPSPLGLKSWPTSKLFKLWPPNLATFPKNYLGIFKRRPDVYVNIEVAMETVFWQPFFFKICIFPIEKDLFLFLLIKL